MKKKLILLLTILLSYNSFSQEVVEVYKKKKFNKEFQRSADGLRKKNKKLILKLNEQFSNVEAEEMVMQTPEVFTEGKGGRKRIKGLKAPKHYRLKKDNSFGVMTVTEDGVIGAIDSLNITNDSLVKSPENQVLETEESPIEYNSPNGVQKSQPPTTAENIVSQSVTMLPQSVRKVYIVDFDLYTQLGSSVQNCLNWAQSLHAGVLPYYQQIGITNTLFKVIVITDVNKSYQNLNTSSEALLKVATDYQNEDGDLIHLLTAKGYGGLAYLSSIGPNSNIRFALSGVFTNLNLNNNYSWTINVVAHEEGHSYGSRHTQWCGWYKPDGSIGRLDSCWAGEGAAYSSGCSPATKSSGGQGTIMSYCQNNGGINLSKGFFFPQIKEQMRRTLMNSTVAGGPTNTCTWTYGPWSPCIGLANGVVYPDGNGYQTRTATPSQDICKGYPIEATARACWVSTGTPLQPVTDFVATYTSGVEEPTTYKVYQNLTGLTAVSFKDKTTGIPSTWSWDFGDGKTSTQQNPSNLYSNAGIYTVKLNASNVVGTASASKSNFVWIVGNNGLPIPDFGALRTSGPAPLAIQFANLSSTNCWDFIWNFKNSQGTLVGSSTEREPRFTFQNPGVYSVSLSAFNKNGTNTIEKTSLITVTGSITIPVANFTATPLTGVSPLNVQFTDNSTNGPTSWSWNFGNNLVSGERNPSTIYSVPGVYTVSLTTSNSAGSNTFTRTNYITVTTTPPPPPPSTPVVTVYKKSDGRWYVNFKTNSTQTIITNVCRYGFSPCSTTAPQACGQRTSPTTIKAGDNEYLINPQPTPPSSGIWCYRVSVTQANQVYWSNFFEFIR